jgi:hypothetical protein
LDDYYRELGIDPTEMKPKAGDEELYKTQAKQKKKQVSKLRTANDVQRVQCSTK